MGADRLSRWRDLAAGLRARTTLAAVLVVGVVLTLGGIGLLWATADALTDAVRTTAETRARDIGVLAESGALPAVLPSRGEALIVQVIGPDEQVLAASPDLAGAPPLAGPRLVPGASVSRRIEWPEIEDEDRDDAGADADLEPAWMAAYGVETSAGPATVIVVAGLGPVERATEVLAPLLALALPVILLATAALVWHLVGRTLRPVEAIRARAAAISADDLATGVPVPATRDEVQRLALTLNDLITRIRASTEQRRRFVADASHELRSPIAAIRTMLEVARDYPEAVEQGELVRDLLREDLRLERLADDLLTLARHDERGLTLHPRDVALADLLREEASATESGHGLPVHADVADAPTLTVDPALLRRALRNLLDNAARHAQRGVWLDVQSSASPYADPAAPSTVDILVSDDGPGIAPADRERVFERFVRLDEARGRDVGGAGLGLAVARAVARAHGGTLAAVEPTHGGATFALRLPVDGAPRA